MVRQRAWATSLHYGASTSDKVTLIAAIADATTSINLARTGPRDSFLYQCFLILTRGPCSTRRACDSGKVDGGVPPCRLCLEMISMLPS